VPGLRIFLRKPILLSGNEKDKARIVLKHEPLAIYNTSIAHKA
jgi:hypothetical protein